MSTQLANADSKVAPEATLVAPEIALTPIAKSELNPLETDERLIAKGRKKEVTDSAKSGIAPVLLLAAGEQASSPTDKLYEKFASVFGNDNPQQLFSLVWPGTVLDYDPYQLPEGKSGTPDTLVQIPRQSAP